MSELSKQVERLEEMAKLEYVRGFHGAVPNVDKGRLNTLYHELRDREEPAPPADADGAALEAAIDTMCSDPDDAAFEAWKTKHFAGTSPDIGTVHAAYNGWQAALASNRKSRDEVRDEAFDEAAAVLGQPGAYNRTLGQNIRRILALKRPKQEAVPEATGFDGFKAYMADYRSAVAQGSGRWDMDRLTFEAGQANGEKFGRVKWLKKAYALPCHATVQGDRAVLVNDILALIELESADGKVD